MRWPGPLGCTARTCFFPIGFDAYGLPAENAAIKNGIHPADWTDAEHRARAAAVRRYAVSSTGATRSATCDPEFYRWNQWLFLRFLEAGLAYRTDGYVNWCPVNRPCWPTSR